MPINDSPVQPQDAVPEFDFDAWLDDIELPTATVTIYKSRALLDRVEEITRGLTEARVLAGPRTPEGSLGDDVPANVRELERQRDAAVLQAKTSGQAFTLRALTQEVYDDLIKKYTGRDGRFDGGAFAMEALAECLVDPNLTLLQVQKLRKRLHPGEYVKLTNAVDELVTRGADLPL